MNNKCLLKAENYIQIQPFMVVNLHLSSHELIIYAAIYGITINKGVFFGSLEYLAQWCNCTERTVTSCLTNLLEKGLLIRKKTQKGYAYVATEVDTDLPKIEQEELKMDLSLFEDSDVAIAKSEKFGSIPNFV